MRFRVDDVVVYRRCTTNEGDEGDVIDTFVVVGESNVSPREIAVCEFPVFQVLAVRRFFASKVVIAACTEDEVISLSEDVGTACDSVSFDDVKYVRRDEQRRLPHELE